MSVIQSQFVASVLDKLSSVQENAQISFPDLPNLPPLPEMPGLSFLVDYLTCAFSLSKYAVLGGLVGIVAIPGSVLLILAALGFTTAGIAAGSIAAGWMAGFNGFVPTASLFSALQSIGALGLRGGFYPPIMKLGGIVGMGVGIYLAWSVGEACAAPPSL